MRSLARWWVGSKARGKGSLVAIDGLGSCTYLLKNDRLMRPSAENGDL